MIDRAGPCPLDDIKHVAEVAYIPAHNIHLVDDVVYAVWRRIEVKEEGLTLPSCQQQPSYL